MKKSELRNQGFSFTELVVAIFVLAAGIMPVMWFFSRSNMGTIKTRDEIMAQQYAAELLDYAMARGYDDLEITPGEGSEISAIEIAGEKMSVDSRFTRRLLVKELRPDHNSEWPCAYKTVSAEVSWLIETRPRHLRLTGLLYAARK